MSSSSTSAGGCDDCVVRRAELWRVCGTLGWALIGRQRAAPSFQRFQWPRGAMKESHKAERLFVHTQTCKPLPFDMKLTEIRVFPLLPVSLCVCYLQASAANFPPCIFCVSPREPPLRPHEARESFRLARATPSPLRQIKSISKAPWLRGTIGGICRP